MRNKRIHRYVATFLLLLLPALAAAQGDDLLGLYTLAKERDPFIGRAKARLESSKADKDIVTAQFLPRVDAGAGINWITNTTLNYDPKGTIHGSFTGDNYGVGARLPLFQLSNNFNLSASRAGIRGSDAGLTAAQQDLITRLASAYFGLLKAQADEELYRDEMKRLAQILEQVQAFLKAGTGDIIAVYEARARLDAAAAELVKAESQRRLAQQQLSAIAGREVSAVKDLGSIEPRGPESDDLEWWIKSMLKNQPALTQARESLNQAEEQRKSVKAGHLPTVSASGGYSVSKGSTFLPQVETRQWYVGLSLSLPIYSGGEISARTRRALAAASEQLFILNDAVDQNTQKVKENFLNLQYNIAIIKSLRQKKSSAEIQLDATKKGRSIGTRTAVDLLNAEQGLAVSKRDMISALYDNAQRRLQLKASVGVLTEEDLLELNNQLLAPPALPAEQQPAGN